MHQRATPLLLFVAALRISPGCISLRISPGCISELFLSYSLLQPFTSVLDASAPATFHDPSACFSEDEWKLLQEWQKELCRKVMKEIHQALISLGPLIATTVSSLRAREKAELCPTENQFCEGKHRMHQPSSFPFFEADTCSRKEEPVSICVDHLGAELRGRAAEPDHGLEVVSFCIKEEEVCSVKSPGPDRINRARSPASTVLPQYQQGLTRKVVDMVQNLEPGDERMTRKKKVEDGLKYPAKRPPPKAISGRISMMVLPSCDKEAHPRNLKWGETHPESIEEKTSHILSVSTRHYYFLYMRSVLTPHAGVPSMRSEVISARVVLCACAKLLASPC
ncbi:hypothetical protein NDU88_008958 [Pleurodeles waltl]|uniref:KRAB domain-containing protein n=1 Tax=Pleurodeles waltl TaxID=8319 RepID=A0AAV7N7Z7_PLEWA|nr:hypothetical protein NDU88_008958 [Pleurodeles waltl]